MTVENNKFNNTVNIKEITIALLNKWYILCIVVAISMIISLIYSYFFVTPLYVSGGKLYIMNKNSQNINTGDLSVSSYLTRDYENLIVDHAVLGEVAKELDYKYSYGELRNAVTVNNPENTRFIEITVKSPNATDSKIIVDTICEISQEKIVDLLGIDRVTIIRKGSLPSRPSTPNIIKNLYSSIIFGIAAYIIVFCVIYFLSDKINTPEDIEKYLEISVLGNIPYNQSKRK